MLIVDVLTTAGCVMAGGFLILAATCDFTWPRLGVANWQRDDTLPMREPQVPEFVYVECIGGPVDGGEYAVSPYEGSLVFDFNGRSAVYIIEDGKAQYLGVAVS